MARGEGLMWWSWSKHWHWFVHILKLASLLTVAHPLYKESHQMSHLLSVIQVGPQRFNQQAPGVSNRSSRVVSYFAWRNKWVSWNAAQTVQVAWSIWIALAGQLGKCDQQYSLRCHSLSPSLQHWPTLWRHVVWPYMCMWLNTQTFPIVSN